MSNIDFDNGFIVGYTLGRQGILTAAPPTVLALVKLANGVADYDEFYQLSKAINGKFLIGGARNNRDYNPTLNTLTEITEVTDPLYYWLKSVIQNSDGTLYRTARYPYPYPSYFQKWDIPTSAWVTVSTLSTANGSYSSSFLLTSDDRIFFMHNSYPNGGILYEIVSGALVARTPYSIGLTNVISAGLVEYSGKIYMQGSATHILYEWNGTDAWVAKTGADNTIKHLLSTPVGLLAISSTGELKQWNGADSWVVKAPQLPPLDMVGGWSIGDGLGVAWFNDTIYAAAYNRSTATEYLGYWGDDMSLLKWNGVDSWELVCATPDNQTISDLMVWNEELYATSPEGAYLMKLTGS